MEIRGKKIIEDFCRKHADATMPLQHWMEYIEMAEWTNHNELKASFPSADYVGNGRYAFNIKGNNYRLVAVVVFLRNRFDIRFLGTHADYNKIKNIKMI